MQALIHHPTLSYRLKLYNNKKEQHQALLIKQVTMIMTGTTYHTGIFGEVTSTPYPCNSKFQAEV